MPNREVINYLKKITMKMILHIFWIFPVEHNKITLLNELSYTYGDSLKYLDMYIHDHCKGKYKIVFPIKKGAIPSENDDVTVVPGTFGYFREILTSGVIITNAGGISYLPKRKGQLVINTWHGGGPYKKTSADVYDNFWYRKEVKMNSDNVDYILSTCKNFTEVEARSLGFGLEKCVPVGLPRNDLLLADHKEIVKKVRAYYSIPERKKFILYAPTFRSNVEKIGKAFSGNIDLDVDMLLSALEEKTGSEWVCGIRLHPKLADMDMTGMNVINCTEYPDMQELLCCADAIITDYSSLMWDYSLTYRPVFLYAPDIDKYERERGFYLPVSEWPYPLAHSNDEMKTNILSFNNDAYVQRVREHHIATGCCETGAACRRTVELFEALSSSR